MIIGVITVVAVIVTRMPQSFGSIPNVPATLALPEGVKPQAITFGKGWTAVVTQDDHILIYSTDGRLQQDVPILADQ
jgi:hypothetical protein